MKIGILTQPLQDNYGGLLQAYALKEVLQLMGHEVVIIDRRFGKAPTWRVYLFIVKSLLKRRRLSPNIFLSQELRDEVSKETRQFREKYILNLSELITDQKEMEKLNSMGFDAYVVGSDQCWRPKYSPSIRNYFLDFATNDNHVKRIAYAASFGVSHWEFTEEDTLVCRKLLQKFDAVSVREDSAIHLLDTYLDRKDARHLVDPTMLLTPERYAAITNMEKSGSSAGNFMVYILDELPEKQFLVRRVEEKLALKAFEVFPAKRLNEEKVTEKNIADFVYPNPSEWLRGFQDAKFVVTDSFHGIIFSILHNIPFITIGNKNRGLSRFESLLNMFALMDRLMLDIDGATVDNLISKEIDWQRVNKKLEEERDKAKEFLANVLSER